MYSAYKLNKQDDSYTRLTYSFTSLELVLYQFRTSPLPI